MNQRLAAILANVFGLRTEQVVLDMEKSNLSQWDSLKQMDLVLSIEREFNVSLAMPDIVRMNSVKSIVQVLSEKGIDFGN